MSGDFGVSMGADRRAQRRRTRLTGTLRLLAGAAALACATCLQGCTFGPGGVPDIEGRVIDELTREPVAGAEVFVSFRVSGPMMSPVHVASRWTTADAEGRFEIPSYSHRQFVLFAVTSDLPIFVVYHARYGRVNKEFGEALPFPGWRSVELPIRVNSVSLELAKQGDPGEYLCLGIDDKACRHIREVVYGESGRR